MHIPKRLLKLALLMAILGAIILAPSMASMTQAQTGITGGGTPTLGEALHVDGALYPFNPDGTVNLLVELNGAPAAVAYSEAINGGASSTEAAAASSEAVADAVSQQLQVRSELFDLGANEIYSVQRVLNAMIVSADPADISAIAAMPNVKGVYPAPVHTIDNSTSVPFIGANQAWDTSGNLSSLGLTGAGVSVAIIDTGTDYLHRNFNGSANYAAQTDTATLADTGGWPQGRVVGGWDFAGDAYTGTNTPAPDPDPTDCNGHGSHVSGSAVGNGVDAGAAFTGPYDDLTTGDLADFDLGPGVAPEADIYALKVFGCTGSTNVTLQALDWALDPNNDDDLSDHVDVVNMSLGSSYGFEGYEAVIQNMTDNGVIIVTSAGNSGDVHYVHGTPGGATSAIATASSNDNGNFSATVGIDNNGDSVIDVNYVAVPQTYPNTPVGYVTFPASPTILERPNGTQANTNCSTTGNPALNWCTAVNLGCDASNYTGFTPGRVAVVNRGSCAGHLKVYRAQQAGAVAVIIVSTAAAQSLASDPQVPNVTVPSVMISSTAGALLPVINGTPRGQLNEAGVNLADHVSGFSSRGPRRANLGGGEVLLKPDITAPGSSINSTNNCYMGFDFPAGPACNGTQSVLNSGTSMASPHVAGVMALLRELHPTWTVADLKALVMNTANHQVYETNPITGAPSVVPHGTYRIGAGRVDVMGAATEDVIAYSNDIPDAVSVAWTTDVLGGTSSSENRTITVENKEAFSVTYNLSTQTLTDHLGISFSVSPSSITVPANSTNTFTVTVNYNAAAMTHTMDANSLTTQNTFARHWITEESGYAYLDAQTGATVDLRVPLYAAPRPASDMDSPALVNTGASTGVASIPLTGTDVNVGAGVSRYRSQVSGFQLLHTSPEINAGFDVWDGGDIEYVGVSSDVPVGGARSYFGISMHGNWDTPRMREVFVCMDLNQDGTGGAFGDGTDWCMRARTDGTQANGVLSDAHMVYLYDINNFLGAGAGAIFGITEYQSVKPDVLDTRLTDNNVFLMASGTTPAYWNSLIGPTAVKYTGGNTTDPGQGFNFRVFTQEINDPNLTFLGLLPITNPVTDSTPLLSFNPTAAVFTPNEGFFGVAGRMVPMVDDLNATAFDWVYSLAGAGTEFKADLMFVHHYNVDGDRVDIVTVNAPPTVPVLSSPANGATGVANAVPLDWADSTGTPSGYQVQVDNNNDFSSTIVDTTVATSTYMTPALAGGTYFWRVRSTDVDGAFSAWSTVWSFTTQTTSYTAEVGGSPAGSCAKLAAQFTFKLRGLQVGHNYTVTTEVQDGNNVYMTRRANTTFAGPAGTQINFKVIIYPINQVPGLVVLPEVYQASWTSLPSTALTTFTVYDKTSGVQTQTVFSYNCSTGAVSVVSETTGPLTNPLYNLP